MSLKEYVRKRDFRVTAEPKGDRRVRRDRYRFVIQKHAASRLHYDFRLELGGTLKSWAVPKGVPYRKGERRLAVHVEDHPVSYIAFEGTIPKGQYGGGSVMVWDRGTFEPLSADPLAELKRGKLHFVLHGTKLEGEWYLVQLRSGDEWLLIKGGTDLKPLSAKKDDTSAISGHSMAQIAKAGGAEWTSDRSGDDGLKPLAKKPARKATSAQITPQKSAGRGVARTQSRSRPAKAPTRTAESDEDASPRAKTADAAKAGSGPGGRGRRRAPGALTPEFIEPMKARLVEAAPAGEWIYEIKFDGFRAMAYRDRNGVRLLSRNNHDLAGKFPEVAAAVAELAVSDAVIDGEIVALDEKGRSSFQLLQAYDLGEERPPIYFYAFDLLQLDGADLRDRPLTERKTRLAALLTRAPEPLRFSAGLGSDATALLEQARKLQLEGLIGKQPDSPYEAGRRSGAWIKLKLHQEQEFVIGGYTPPRGGRSHFGALLVGVYEGGELIYAGKVGTGFDAMLLASLHARLQALAGETCPFADLPEKRRGRGQVMTAAEMRRCHWVRPELVCQLRFAEWTRDDRLRHPVFLGLREDKAAREVVREKAS